MKRAICVFLLTVFIVFLFSPVFVAPRKKAEISENYLCVWENSDATRESYAFAFRDIYACTEEEILLERDGTTGFIATGTEARNVFRALEADTPLAKLLSLNPKTLNRLELAAITREFENRLWYDGDWFCFEEGFRRAQIRTAREVFLLSGKLPANALKDTGAQKLILGKSAAVSASDFCGSSVTEISAYAPYSYQDGALFYQTAAGKRLIAALPLTQSLCTVDMVACEEGALAPCTALEELTLPFVGNFADANAGSYRGDFSYLFGESEIPQSIVRVKVTGGALVPYAFWGSRLQEINACGVAAEKIDEAAFLGIDTLRLLHSPREDVLLNKPYASHSAPCGCTVFEIQSG